MSLLAGLQKVYFKEDGSGNTVWFPWGTWAPGYSLSQAQAKKAKQLQTAYFATNMVLGPLLMFNNMYLLVVGNLIITSIYFLYKLRTITKGASRIKNKSTFKERLELIAKGTGFKSLLLYFLFLLTLSLMFGFVVFSGVKSVWAIALFLFFALGTIWSGILLAYSFKSQRGFSTDYKLKKRF